MVALHADMAKIITLRPRNNKWCLLWMIITWELSFEIQCCAWCKRLVSAESGFPGGT